MGRKISGSGIGTYAGTDQGVDFTSKGLIPALANAIVTDVGRETDIEGQHGNYVIYKLLSGARKGQYVYSAENLLPTVKVGQRLRAGQTIGINQGITSGGTGIEIGFNNAPSGWNPVAPLGQGAAAHGSTQPGQDMWSYIQAVQKGLPGPSGSDTPMYGLPGPTSSPSHSVGGGGLPNQMLSLAQFVLSNNANRQNLVPLVDPIAVHAGLVQPNFTQPKLTQLALGGGIQGGRSYG